MSTYTLLVECGLYSYRQWVPLRTLFTRHYKSLTSWLIDWFIYLLICFCLFIYWLIHWHECHCLCRVIAWSTRWPSGEISGLPATGSLLHPTFSAFLSSVSVESQCSCCTLWFAVTCTAATEIVQCTELYILCWSELSRHKLSPLLLPWQYYWASSLVCT